MNNYQQHAADAYNTINSLFQGYLTSGNFWQIGCTFDTVLDYKRQVGNFDSDIIQNALDIYNNLVNTNSACWYDDYAWWGIAAAKAYDSSYKNVFGDLTADFQKIARDCWDTMHNGKGDDLHLGAPKVWINRCAGEADKDYFFDTEHPENWAAPRFEKGVWQYDMFYEARAAECNQNVNPANPITVNLGPFQNTVMNGLYFVLALRLLKAGVDTQQAITDEFDFLNAWFFLKGKNDQPDTANALLNGIPPAPTLVRERVSTYALCGSETEYRQVGYYNSEAAWCGDQGLMLGALTDYYLQDKNTNQVAYTIAIALIDGVAAYLTESNVVQSVSKTWPAGDADDYSSGTGIFMRYLLYAGEQDDTIHSVLTAAQYQSILTATADYYIANPNPTTNDLFNVFNSLATFTTALEFLKD